MAIAFLATIIGFLVIAHKSKPIPQQRRLAMSFIPEYNDTVFSEI